MVNRKPNFFGFNGEQHGPLIGTVVAGLVRSGQAARFGFNGEQCREDQTRGMCVCDCGIHTSYCTTKG
jgi:hypothetical protein